MSNEKHVQVTDKNGLWLFHQFINDPQIITCPYACPSSTGIGLNLSGPNTVCNSTAVFTATNAPIGANTSIIWSQSSNINPVSGQGTSTFSVNKINSGSGFVKVSANGDCGTAEKQLTVRVGGYSSIDYPVSGPTSICTNTSTFYNTNDLLGATNYTWFWPSNWFYEAGQGSPFLYVNTGSTVSGGAVGVRVANACDAGGSPSTYFVNVIFCGYYSMAISPNPTSSTLTTEIIEAEQGSGRMIEEIQLLDDSGAPVRSWSGSARKTDLDVNGLPSGYYVVKLKVNSEVTTARILIE